MEKSAPVIVTNFGVIHDTQKESFADPFRIMTSIVRNGKKIFSFNN